MLHLGQQVRFSASELEVLRKVTGPCFFEPRTLSQLTTLSRQSREFWLDKGQPELAAAVGKLAPQVS